MRIAKLEEGNRIADQKRLEAARQLALAAAAAPGSSFHVPFPFIFVFIIWGAL